MAKIFKPPKGNKGRGSGKAVVLTVDIAELDHHGVGVATEHRPVVFVEGALPGERCEVRIEQQRNRFWHGKATKVIESSDQRTEPFCPHFGQCGGCQHQYLSPPQLLAHKQQAIDTMICRQTEVSLLPWQPPLTNQQTGYRRKTRLAIDARNPHQIKLGYRGKGSSKVVAVAQCPLLVPALQPLIPELQNLLPELKGVAQIGHISLLAADNLTQLCIRVKRQMSKADMALWQNWADTHQVSVWLEDDQGQFSHLAGDDSMAYISSFADNKLFLQPNDFVQVNGEVNRQMVSQALQWLDICQHDAVLDLFCGVGNFTLPIAQSGASVHGVEGVAEMVQRARYNAQQNGMAGAEFSHLDLSADNWQQQFSDRRFNKILLDPSREGAQAVVSQLGALQPERILYVSCNPSSFARDARVLNEQGYGIDKIALMDMFSYTSHTELMALFVPETTQNNKRNR